MSDKDFRGQTWMAQWKHACANFDFGVRASVTSLVSALETTAKALAQNSETRANLGESPSLWSDLRKLWRDLARAQLTFWDGDDSEGEDGESGKNKQRDLRAVCASLAKCTRNLVAGVADNQNRAFENEPDIRRLLHYYTSWSAMEDPESIPVARLLAQTLSNMVTMNEPLIAKLWETYLSLPEDQVILIRLLSSPDPRTLLTAFVFILNCIHGNRKRTEMLSRTTIGARICISLLDDMLKLHEAEESSDGAQAFDVGYDILTRLIEQGLVPDLYSKFTIPGEIVTPHQTALLKIIDSYLQSIQMSATAPATSRTIRTHVQLSPMLARCFFELSGYAQHAVERALRPSATRPSALDQKNASTSSLGLAGSPEHVSQQTASGELNVMLPKVCEALVLVTQCIITVTLEADRDGNSEDHGPRSPTTEPTLKEFYNEARSSGRGLVESLIELLRLLDLFLPRINFGKPVMNPPSAETTPTSIQQSTEDGSGFQYLKRDLVRLLGILCHGTKAVQDRVRSCGGIQVVMNLCIVDERNPYLREHAIFTLHGLLKDNPDNQAVVDAIKPIGGWDENGMLKDSPGPVRK